MANDLQGIFTTRIARLTLDALLTEELPVTSFYTDFSPEVADFGNAVTTRYPNALSVADFSTAKTLSSANTTPATITLNKYIGTGFSFTDTEIAFSDLQLMDIFVRPAVVALFENVMAQSLALVTPANFSSNVTMAAAGFNANNVAAISGTQTTLKVPRKNRHLLLNPSYAQTLKTDPSVQAAFAYGPGNTIGTGIIPKVHGYDIHEWDGNIPSTNNLAAVAFAPQAILSAARPPTLPRNWFGEVRNVTNPNTGLTIQFRDYYDGTVQRSEWCFIYGVQIGLPGNLTRIVSA